jgi:hypothetical protein
MPKGGKYSRRQMPDGGKRLTAAGAVAITHFAVPLGIYAFGHLPLWVLAALGHFPPSGLSRHWAFSPLGIFAVGHFPPLAVRF